MFNQSICTAIKVSGAAAAVSGAKAASAPLTSDVAAKLDEALQMALAESLTKHVGEGHGKPAAAAAEAKAAAVLERAELKEIKQDLQEFREVCFAFHSPLILLFSSLHCSAKRMC